MGGSEEPSDMLKLETASDAALVVGIARTHEPALAEAYRRHGGAVLALARRVLGSADLAEEVTQEVFVGLWDAPERFDPGRGALRTFLMTKAHGRSVDIVRSETARRQGEERTVRETAVSGYDIEHEVWDLAIAEPGEGGGHEPARRGAHRHRDGVLRRPHLPRGGHHPGPARGDGEEPDPQRLAAPALGPGPARGGNGMDRTMTHDEIAELLGAYALDAVEADEAELIAAHLAECPRCAAEVAEHWEVTGLIANAGVDAPPEIWDRIAARIDTGAGGQAAGAASCTWRRSRPRSRTVCAPGRAGPGRGRRWAPSRPPWRWSPCCSACRWGVSTNGSRS